LRNSIRYILLCLVFTVLGLSIYAYLEFTRKPADLINSDAVEHSTASELTAFYINNEDSANKKYLGKVIEVTGTIVEIENQQDTLITVLLGDTVQESRVSCLIDKKHFAEAKNIRKGDVVKIKGFCTGYLMDVELNRCVIE
jgi:tRNA_anti-like